MSYWQKTSKLIVTLVLLGAIIGQVTPNIIAASTVPAKVAANNAVAESDQLERINQAVNDNDGVASEADSESAAPVTDDETATEEGTSEEVPTEEITEDSATEAEAATADPEKDTAAETEAEPKEALDEEPAAPTTADGVNKVSRNASVILGLAMRNGFITQPQAEQYVVEGTEVNLDSQVIETGILGSNPKVGGFMWEYNQDTKAWVSSPIPAVSTTSNGFMSSRYNAKFRYGDGNALQPGYYYFQFRFTKSLLWNTYYYSKLVKVVVLEGEVPATDLSITPESPVVFPSMDYEARANLNPTNSTSVVKWSSNDPVAYEPETGRVTDFNVDKSVIASDINTSTENPGLPVTLAANANDLDADATVYVGGLKAKSLAIDQAQLYGMTWQVDGLDKITKEFFTADEDEPTATAATSVKYSWKYYYINNGKYVSGDFPDSTNGSGTFTTPSELNTTKLLTIAPDSTFFTAAQIATAAKQNFYAQLTINFTYNKEKIEIKTNFAQIDVTGKIGNLTLEAVPTFTFVGVTAAQIYDGNLNTPDKQPVSKGDTENMLSIMDTRPNDQDWQLSAYNTP